MIKSMTAFARQEKKSSVGALIWEIRSVNHRYLDLTFKLPDQLKHLEPKLRDLLRGYLGRGKVECSLKLQTDSSTHNTLGINQNLVQELLKASHSLQKHIVQGAPIINVIDILKWPGVTKEPDLNTTLLIQECLGFFELALKDLDVSRAREGQALQAFIQQRLDSVENIINAVRTCIPEIIATQQRKLKDKLATLTAGLDAGRVEQEIVLLANKMDISEELDRLAAHTEETKRVLEAGGDCGRRLDFLMQELNREANTLAAKSVVSDSTLAAVELKVLIEQMREQIQNIE